MWLSQMPIPLRTRELCMLAVQDSENSVLKHVPDYFRDYELCLEAVKHDGLSLKYVPEHLQTEEMCFAAVKQDWLSMEFVLDKYKTFRLYMFALTGLEFCKRLN